MKKTIKNVLSLLLAAVLLTVPLTGCNKGPAPSAAPASSAAPAPAASADPPSDAAPTTDAKILRLAHNITMGGIDDEAANMFAEKVKEKSGGTLEVRVYAGGQLGNERDMLEGIKMGTIDMGMNTSAYISNLCPQYGLLDLPYMFTSFEDVRAKLAGEAGTQLSEMLLKDHGIRVLNWWNSSFRVMLTKSAPIESIGDLKGRKMRAPEVPVYIDMFTALGANPTPIPFGEVYTSIQTGVVDGVEVCAEEMYSMKFHEVGQYIAKTNHIFSCMIPIINEKVYEGLTDAEKAAVNEAMSETTDWQWEAFAQSDEHALRAMIDAGITLTEPDIAPFMEACKPMQEKYAADYQAEDLLALLMG